MKLDVASLAMGAGIGVAIATMVVVVVFVMQPGALILDDAKVLAAVSANNKTHFSMSCLIK